MQEPAADCWWRSGTSDPKTQAEAIFASNAVSPYTRLVVSDAVLANQPNNRVDRQQGIGMYWRSGSLGQRRHFLSNDQPYGAKCHLSLTSLGN